VPFRAILFDVDRTIVGSLGRHAAARVGASNKFEREIAFDELHEPTSKGEDHLMSVFVPLEELKNRGQDLERRRGKIFREQYLPHVSLLSGARDLLRRSRAADLQALHGLGPEEAIAVGDTPYDGEAAGKAGIATVGVLSGGFSEGAPREAGCLTIYCAPDHLLAELDASPLAGRGAA
jgi:phosphoglycolate phosphatase-like HAD superfamily hydrolase